jgi:hypothetical protein
LDYFIEIVPPSTCTSTKINDFNSSRSNRERGNLAVNPNSINESALENAFLLYPNPANENVQLNFEGFSGETQLHIFDVSGRLLIQKNINEGVNLISINTQELPAGSYLIRLGSNQNRMYRKLIVQH